MIKSGVVSVHGIVDCMRNVVVLTQKSKLQCRDVGYAVFAVDV